GGLCPPLATFNLTNGLAITWGPPEAPGVTMCEPGQGEVNICPCGNNPGGPGRGCNNSTLSGGGTLTDVGTASTTFDNAVFASTDLTAGTVCSLRQGSSVIPVGVVFGDGLKCWGGFVLTLYVKTTSGAGTIFMPDFTANDRPIALRSAQLGDVILPG